MKNLEDYQEWFLLLYEAKSLGITAKEIEEFLNSNQQLKKELIKEGL